MPSNPPKSPVVAVILSIVLFFFLPLGHFYIGQALKGIIWIAITWFTFGIGSIVAAVDAYMVAKKLKSGQPVGKMEWFPSS
jgi:TM2 domain-containing membrane protein YozV